MNEQTSVTSWTMHMHVPHGARTTVLAAACLSLLCLMLASRPENAGLLPWMIAANVVLFTVLAVWPAGATGALVVSGKGIRYARVDVAWTQIAAIEPPGDGGEVVVRLVEELAEDQLERVGWARRAIERDGSRALVIFGDDFACGPVGVHAALNWAWSVARSGSDEDLPAASARRGSG